MPPLKFQQSRNRPNCASLSLSEIRQVQSNGSILFITLRDTGGQKTDSSSDGCFVMYNTMFSKEDELSFISVQE